MTMTATEILRAEHELISTALAILENICKRWEREEAVEPADVHSLLDFFAKLADRLHHAKEEDILFPIIEEAGISTKNDLIGNLLAEHTLGRAFVGSMKDDLELLRNGDLQAAESLAETARGYICLLVQHICKENRILYVSVEEHLGARGQAELLERFEQVEPSSSPTGISAQFQEAITELEATYGSSDQVRRLCG